MGLNDLHLSPAVLSRLYPSSLINTDKTEVVQPHVFAEDLTKNKIESEKLTGPSWKYLGNNQQNILIVVNYNDAVHLPDEELNFLTNMLAACKLSLGDVAIVNRNNYKDVFYKDILTHFQSKIVFLFGIEPAMFGLPVSFPYFQVQSVASSTFLYTPALEERHTDALLKSKLWVSLRSIFDI
jgi:maltodextrin utilization protein YvdJ